MFKLLFSTAMIAPVLVFAAGGLLDSGDSLIDATPRTAVLASGALPGDLGTGDLGTDLRDGPECRSETVPLVFHSSLLEMHSATALQDAFAARVGCEVSFVRLTTLVPEDADEVDVADANSRRAEVAATIAAVVGSENAMDLEMRADMQTTESNTRLRHHAILRVERRPVADAPAPAAQSVASAGSSTRSLN